MPDYRVIEGALHDKFLSCRVKVQIFGGGFANGKTAAVCIKTLQIARDYPGANILMARATYPKLNDTLRKEMMKWCPDAWVKRTPTKDDNTLYLKNGTAVNFRYVAQQGKGGETPTSNTLSATYDLVVVDQVEDPEITYKDFTDLLGRMRGSTRYKGSDPTMPRTGPRLMLLTCNPNRGWVYKKLVRPYHRYVLGVSDKDLIAGEDGKSLIEVFEGSTYENKANLPEDYIKSLEAAYHGQFRDRFLLGKWASYEGLVYPSWDELMHVVGHDAVASYINDLRDKNVVPTVVEGYDHGLAVPACYLLSFVDQFGNVFIVDGFYKNNLRPCDIADMVNEIRDRWAVFAPEPILADPSIFRRSGGVHKTVGKTVAQLLQDEGLQLRRGNNDVTNGILKVSGYLAVQDRHFNPVSGQSPAPYLYVSDRLEFVANEFSGYFWKKDNQTGEPTDTPVDKNDHAMDTIKYLLSDRPKVADIYVPRVTLPDPLLLWGERQEAGVRQSSVRHRSRIGYQVHG